MALRPTNGRALTWRDSDLQDEHPVADMRSAEDIAELGTRIKAHTAALSYDSFDRFMSGRGTPRSIDELRTGAGELLEDRMASTPMFQPFDRYLTESGGPLGRAHVRGRR